MRARATLRKRNSTWRPSSSNAAQEAASTTYARVPISRLSSLRGTSDDFCCMRASRFSTAGSVRRRRFSVRPHWSRRDRCSPAQRCRRPRRCARRARPCRAASASWRARAAPPDRLGTSSTSRTSRSGPERRPTSKSSTPSAVLATPKRRLRSPKTRSAAHGWNCSPHWDGFRRRFSFVKRETVGELRRLEHPRHPVDRLERPHLVAAVCGLQFLEPARLDQYVAFERADGVVVGFERRFEPAAESGEAVAEGSYRLVEILAE